MCPYLVEALPGPLFTLGSVATLYSSLYSTSFFHLAGSCRMPGRYNGMERSALDAELRVRGVAGLRVADCSIFPAMPSSPTAATAMAVGRRAAELVTEVFR